MTIDEKIKDLVLSSHFCCMDDAQMWADEASDFLRDNADALLSALADQRRYRYLRDIGHPDSDEGLAVLVGTMTEWGRWVHIHKSGAALDAAIDAVPLDQEGE